MFGAKAEPNISKFTIFKCCRVLKDQPLEDFRDEQKGDDKRTRQKKLLAYNTGHNKPRLGEAVYPEPQYAAPQGTQRNHYRCRCTLFRNA